MLRKGYHAVAAHTGAEVVLFLGDLLNDGSVVGDDAFAALVSTFRGVFASPASVKVGKRGWRARVLPVGIYADLLWRWGRGRMQYALYIIGMYVQYVQYIVCNMYTIVCSTYDDMITIHQSV